MLIVESNREKIVEEGHHFFVPPWVPYLLWKGVIVHNSKKGLSSLPNKAVKAVPVAIEFSVSVQIIDQKIIIY